MNKLIEFAQTLSLFAGFTVVDLTKVINVALAKRKAHMDKHGKGGEAIARRRNKAQSFSSESEKLANKATVEAIDLIDCLTAGANAIAKAEKLKPIAKPKAKANKRKAKRSA